MSERINRVVTRTGDDGATSLADGRRLRKSAARIDAIGLVDEANVRIGHLRCALDTAASTGAALDAILEPMQHRLFDLGGALSLPGTARFDDAHVRALDEAVATLNADLPALANFVLPAGDEATVRAHLARTGLRTAERALVALVDDEPDAGDDAALRAWLNRASDLLFVVSRTLARAAGDEVLWKPAPRD